MLPNNKCKCFKRFMKIYMCNSNQCGKTIKLCANPKLFNFIQNVHSSRLTKILNRICDLCRFQKKIEFLFDIFISKKTNRKKSPEIFWAL